MDEHVVQMDGYTGAEHRQMDAKVAGLLFGWTSDDGSPLPFSSDATAALQAVERMMEVHKCLVEITLWPPHWFGDTQAKFSCRIHAGELSYESVKLQLTRKAKTAPLAISLAIIDILKEQ